MPEGININTTATAAVYALRRLLCFVEHVGHTKETEGRSISLSMGIRGVHSVIRLQNQWMDPLVRVTYLYI